MAHISSSETDAPATPEKANRETLKNSESSNANDFSTSIMLQNLQEDELGYTFCNKASSSFKIGRTAPLKSHRPPLPKDEDSLKNRKKSMEIRTSKEKSRKDNHIFDVFRSRKNSFQK